VLDVLVCSYLRRLHKEHKIRHKIEIGGRKSQNDRGNCIFSGFTVSSPFLIRGEWGVYSKWQKSRRREMHTDNRRRKLKERGRLKELAGDGKILVRWILKIECDDMDHILLDRTRANGCLMRTLRTLQ
jgi:hypothetical protein